jgi:hypothetical protein
LAELLVQPFGNNACHRIDATTGRHADDDLDWSVGKSGRIVLRQRTRREKQYARN